MTNPVADRTATPAANGGILRRVIPWGVPALLLSTGAMAAVRKFDQNGFAREPWIMRIRAVFGIAFGWGGGWRLRFFRGPFWTSAHPRADRRPEPGRLSRRGAPDGAPAGAGLTASGGLQGSPVKSKLIFVCRLPIRRKISFSRRCSIPESSRGLM